MIGKKERHFAPLINVSLEQLVPHDHFYRHLECTLDLTFVREFVEKTYAHGGRPSIDPIVFFKLQLVMFFEDIRSERLLMRHAADRLSVRWYLGYDLNEPLPDHSSLTKIRTRYGLEVFRRFFEAIVEQCQEAGLVWGRELYFDGTKVAANAGKESVKPRFAVEAHLNGLFGTEAELPGEEEEQQIPQEERVGGDTPVPLPVSLSPEAYEELSQHNAARHDWIEEEGAQDRRVKGRNYQRIADFQVSTTDPDATIMRSKGGVDLGYHTHYVVEGGREGAHHCRSVSDAIGSDGQSTHARLTLACSIPLETLASTRDRRQEVRFGRELGCHRRPGYSCLHSHCRCGSSHRVLQC